MTFLERLSEYGISPIKHSPEIRQKARAAVLDTVGCIMAGCKERSILAASEWATEFTTSEEASIIGIHGACAVGRAAMVNAMAAYACDYDDMCNIGCGHPSMPVFPVALALAESCNSTADEFLEAYIYGVEVSAIVGSGFVGSSLSLSWNPSTICGGFGATICAARLMNLDIHQTANALAMMTCQVGGTKGNYGTSAKDVSVGFVSRIAIGCAQLAEKNIVGSHDAFEGKNGILDCIAPDYRLDVAIKRMENKISVFLDPGVIPKPYPCCRSNHNAIDGMLKIRAEHNLSHDDIEHIHFRIDKPSFALEARQMPLTPEEGKFSTAYCVALALLHGKVTLNDFSGDAIVDRRIVEIIEKCSSELDETFENAHFGNEIEVTTKSGDVFRYRGCFAKGDKNNPMQPEEIKTKFFECATRYFSMEIAVQIYAAVVTNESMCTARTLTEIICGKEI